MASNAFSVRLSSTCSNWTRSALTRPAFQLISCFILYISLQGIESHNLEKLAENVVYADDSARRFAPAYHVSDPLDDLARAMSIRDDVSQQLAEFVRSKFTIREHALSGAGISDHRSDRVVYFMGKRCGELAHQSHTSYPRQLRVLTLAFQLCLPAGSDINA